MVCYLALMAMSVSFIKKIKINFFKILNNYYLLWLLGRGVSSLTILQEVIRMDELVKINYENQRPTVLGRDLHEALEVKT